ncbi:MAG: TIGR04190 family B12-binding domain/radical SAM domain protein [Candidatus Acetothermia bacterium]|jgi:B12-binding domain/radical SAM domain protein|nr:TIGR04190 family B12-binding domain/radical SAM domain protein [Candidatus Acetothermia bacterium]MDH7505977.1 TIGR04190 family B12-binding domain/radical SAM domain protein [Candidatus Acetothermia bacterium]
MSRTDLVLLHPPSIYDFRERAALLGPLSDLIPSSPVFEMYPLGFLTLASYLEARGLRVRLVNLAVRMLAERRFAVRPFLARLKPKLFGIDLHWLPHAHGALEVAHLLKELHPEVPVVVGGLSASYYYRELIGYPQIDYVIRGDCAEEPLYRLLECIMDRRPVADVPNLVWRDTAGIRANEAAFIPDSLDYVDLRPDRLIKHVLRYRDRLSLTPYGGWWGSPVTAILTVKGCTHSCATCGGSREAAPRVVGRARPAYRSPESMMRNILDVARFSRGPIFLIGDIRQPGEAYAEELLRLLRENPLENELIFELFTPAGEEFLRELGRSVRNWTLEMSPESHDPALRGVHDPTAVYDNDELERTLAEALKAGCRRLDIFFMIGLSRQSYRSVMASVDYAGALLRRFDRRLSCFISPLGPFLDPGSRAFEEPESLGYRLFARSLEDHRQLLLRPTWAEMLNYETAWMSREELVRATYDAGERLTELKAEHGRLSPRQAAAVAERIARARELEKELQAYGRRKADPPEGLRAAARAFSVSTVCDKRELAWPREALNFRPLGIARALLSRSARSDSDHPRH